MDTELHILMKIAVTITDNMCTGQRLSHVTVAYLHVPTIKQLQGFREKKNATSTASVSWCEELPYTLHNVVHINTARLKFSNQ